MVDGFLKGLEEHILRNVRDEEGEGGLKEKHTEMSLRMKNGLKERFKKSVIGECVNSVNHNRCNQLQGCEGGEVYSPNATSSASCRRGGHY